jgi:chemotaxis protein methyltransferase CheR
VSSVEQLEIRLLLEALWARYDYDLRGYAPASLRRRILAALARSGAPNLGELQHRVLNDPALFADLLHDLTVPVSELFRDPALYLALRAHVVPVLRTYPLLRIWHAGCATGEEAYASAILLTEEGLYERSQIYATDLSPRSLECAKHGIYPAERRVEFDDNYRSAGGRGNPESFYTLAYEHLALKQALQRNLLFFQHNLVSDQVFGEMQAVFCRNVLIYFGSELRRLILDKLAHSLCPGGFLCLGRSEQLSAAEARDKFVEFCGPERIYRCIATSR